MHKGSSSCRAGQRAANSSGAREGDFVDGWISHIMQLLCAPNSSCVQRDCPFCLVSACSRTELARSGVRQLHRWRPLELLLLCARCRQLARKRLGGGGAAHCRGAALRVLQPVVWSLVIGAVEKLAANAGDGWWLGRLASRPSGQAAGGAATSEA